MVKIKAVMMSLACLIFWQCISAEAGPSSRRRVRRHAAKTRRSERPKESGVVQLKAGQITVSQQDPLRVLCEALKQDKESLKFRVSWSVSALSLRLCVTAIYDREAKTVTFYEAGADDSGPIYSHLLFTNVTDDILFTALEKYGRNSPHAGFRTLPKYGCGQQKLP